MFRMFLESFGRCFGKCLESVWKLFGRFGDVLSERFGEVFRIKLIPKV